MLWSEAEGGALALLNAMGQNVLRIAFVLGLP